MIQIPLSTAVAIAGSAEAFAAAARAHRAALEAHRLGEPGVPAPLAHELLDALVLRVPDANPVIAERKADQFVVAQYTIVEDTPIEPEKKKALEVLRETLAGG